LKKQIAAEGGVNPLNPLNPWLENNPWLWKELRGESRVKKKNLNQ
jgi:hypothetical protein